MIVPPVLTVKRMGKAFAEHAFLLTFELLFWAGDAGWAVEAEGEAPEVQDVTVVYFDALGIHSLKIDVSPGDGVKVRQTGATVRKGVNFRVEGLQRFVVEDERGKLGVFAD